MRAAFHIDQHQHCSLLLASKCNSATRSTAQMGNLVSEKQAI
jgi:hypothetical protein